MAYIYDPDNKFGYKDTLPPESDEKVIRGTDFDAEFKKIQIGVGDSFDEANAGLEQEIEDRIAGDQSLQDQINNLDNAEIIGDLNAEIQARIEGDQNLQDQIDDLLAQPGAGMVISETEPAEEERVPGLQWLDSTTAEVWIWDGDRWLEFPSTEGPAGPPGADGADGNAYWEAYGPNIYYDKGNVGVGTNDPAAQFEVKGSNTNARFRGAGSQLINFNFSQTPSTSEIDVRNAGDFHISMQGVPALTIDNSNNVGVGTEDPKGIFQVRVAPDLNIAMNQLTAEDVARISAYDDAASVSVPLAIEGEYLKLRTNTLDRLIIDASGDATFSGTVSGTAFFNPLGGGILPGGNPTEPALLPTDHTGTLTDGKMNLGNGSYRWKDGHFTGTVTAGGDPWVAGTRLYGTGALYVGTTTSDADVFRGYDGATYTSSINNNGNATFTGTVTAGDLVVQDTNANTRMLVLNASTQSPSAYRQAFAIQSSGTDMLSMATGPASSLNSTTALSLSTPTTGVTFDNASDKATFTGTVNAGNIHTGLGNDTSEVRIHSTASGTSTLVFYKDNAPVVTQQVQASGDGFYWGALGAGGAGFRNVGGYQYSTDSWRFTSQIATFSGNLQANGGAEFKGSVYSNSLQRSGSDQAGISFDARNDNGTAAPYILPLRNRGYSDGGVDLGSPDFRFRSAFFSGPVYVNGSPLTRTRDLIETLSTLRKATMDETQDIRESLRSAIDELILGFEQEIATMPAPEVSTMEIPE